MFKCIFEHSLCKCFKSVCTTVITHIKRKSKILLKKYTRETETVSIFLLFPLHILNWFCGAALSKNTLILYGGRTLAFCYFFRKQNAAQTSWEQHPFDTNTGEVIAQVCCLLRGPRLALLQFSLVETALVCCLSRIMEHIPLSRIIMMFYLEYTLLSQHRWSGPAALHKTGGGVCVCILVSLNFVTEAFCGLGCIAPHEVCNWILLNSKFFISYREPILFNTYIPNQDLCRNFSIYNLK